MTIKVLYIDDEIDRPGRDAQKIRDLLQETNRLECELSLPPKDFSHLLPQLPDGLLIDLDLSTTPEGGEPVSYFGSTLASEVRIRHPACPIALVTRPQLMVDSRRLLEDSFDVDIIMMKADINEDPDGKRAELLNLIYGFQSLEASDRRDWEKVADLMGATEPEANLLRESAPPLVDRQWNVPQLARWIRRVVIGFPGILYDDLTAATRLGIDINSFMSEPLQKFIASARYAGVFAKYENRWWRDRLFLIAQELVAKYELRGSLPRRFREAFYEEFDQELDPAICIYDDTPTADWVCHILKKPVKQQNSVPYYPDDRPAVMDQARVSFKAIEESNDFDESLVDADSREIVAERWA